MTASYNQKTIWIFHHYADPPDGHWTGTYDLYRHLTDAGHRITVFSSSFSHYSRVDERLRPGELSASRNYSGMNFIFIRTSPYFDNGLRRLLNVFSYALNSYRVARNLNERPDIVVGSSPHPFGAIAGMHFAKRHGAKFFFELHDLWPQFLIELGSLSKYNPIAVVMAALERRLFNGADQIFTLWPRMDRYVAKFGVPTSKIHWMPLGVDGKEIAGNLPAAPKASGSLLVMYAGRVGPANDLDVLLDAALILQRGGHAGIRFEIVGGGPEREALMRRAAHAGLTNVVFEDFMPKQKLFSHMKSADAFIGSLADLPHYDEFGVISSKLIDYMAMNRPIIYATGMKNHLTLQADAGLVVAPRDPSALADAVLAMSRMDTAQRAKFGANALRYVMQNHDLRTLAKRVEALF